MDFSIKQGQLITLTFEGKSFEAIVIDPNGLGKGQPSVGFGFNMMERYAGLPKSTISTWVTKESVFEGVWDNENKSLNLPSGKAFRVFDSCLSRSFWNESQEYERGLGINGWQ